jgi:B12-binding domain/radical SAM domain protein
MGADFVVRGEAEWTFPDLLIKLYAHFHKNQRIKDDFVRKNAILEPDSSHLIDLNKYPPYSEKFRVFSPIEISRGCPFKCKFCQIGCYWPKMRHAEIDSIVSWVKNAVKIRYDRVWFTSPNSFAYGSKNGIGTNPNAIKRLLSRIREIPNLKEVFFGTFPSEIRPEFVSEEIIELIKPFIDNSYFTIGAQSASDTLLRKIGRGHNFQTVLKAVDIITDNGYGVDLDFIFGLPGETENDIELTKNYFNTVLRSSKKIRIHTHTFMPLPGTPFEKEKYGVISPKFEKIIGQLATRNKAFGQHHKQSKMNKM